ncbi:MAG: glucose 1-dehydrogenase [Gammaproteobacteria bacterium]|nr:glucose 1-dehydrogenase [Gammaproteobacteria bacterium]
MTLGPRLEGKVAIVTGAASGIGAATARLFGTHGATVIVCDLNEKLGAEVAGSIKTAGGNAKFRALDVSDEEQWVALMEETERSHARLDVLANIAGVSGRDPNQPAQVAQSAWSTVADQSLQSWNRIMDVNSTGVFLGTKHGAMLMAKHGGGSIINISSICGIIGSWSSAAYHASKGSVRLLSKAAAIQCAPQRVRVNSVHPGFIETPMTATAHANNSVAEARLGATPLGRFGLPEDIANGCLYLASDESSYVTGTELVIDGGVVAT